MNKLLLIPRAIADVAVIWNKRLTIKEKSSLTYTFVVLKRKKWLAPENAVITFPILGYRWKGVNNASLQFLIKEIFIDKVYAVGSTKAGLKVADIGANVGLASLFFYIHQPDASIKAFEPNSSSFHLLVENLRANNIKNIEAFHVAVSGKEKVLYKKAGFEDFSINQSFSELESGEEIKALGIAELIQKHQPDCIKMDIEGMEYEVLKAAVNENLLSQVKHWMIEFHEEAKTKTVIEAFEKAGFSYTEVQNIYHFKSADIK